MDRFKVVAQTGTSEADEAASQKRQALVEQILQPGTQISMVINGVVTIISFTDFLAAVAKGLDIEHIRRDATAGADAVRRY